MLWNSKDEIVCYSDESVLLEHGSHSQQAQGLGVETS